MRGGLAAVHRRRSAAGRCGRDALAARDDPPSGRELQVTYAGRPLYYYVGDRRPGQILCQNVSEFGGLWLVARANGTLVR